MSTPAIIIAGTHSGVGKTTVALALMVALRARGLTVQPFKIGPDFIDPGHHTSVCGRVSRNLDTWMLTEAIVRSTFARACLGADVAVLEGVMGLFDGRNSADLRGSTADIARLLRIPVVLVVDAAAVAASVAAVVKGFSEFDPHVHVVGVICNRVHGPSHYAYLEPAIRRHTSVAPLGWLPSRPEWAIPERHLGLMTTADLPADETRWKRLGRELSETVDVDRLLEAAGRGQATRGSGRYDERDMRNAESKRDNYHEISQHCLFATAQCSPRSVAVARDAAFCFYYPENLELLESAGARIVFFSPRRDPELPKGTEIVYLGGGYPELHAQQLAENRGMRESLRRFHARGGAIYAECGGLMYACRELVDVCGKAYPMLDLLPARVVMQAKRVALGYVSWQATKDSLLGPKGTLLRGHEFHYSRLEPLEKLEAAAVLLRDGEHARVDAFVHGGLLAGYAHLHFSSNPSAAGALLGSWLSAREPKGSWK